VGWPKFNQLEMVTTFTYRPSMVNIDARNFELSWQQTHPQTPPARPPQTGPITIHSAAKLSTQCKHLTCDILFRHCLQVVSNAALLLLAWFLYLAIVLSAAS